MMTAEKTQGVRISAPWSKAPIGERAKQLGRDFLYVFPSLVIGLLVGGALFMLGVMSAVTLPFLLIGLLFLPGILLAGGFAADLTRLRSNVWRGAKVLHPRTKIPEFHSFADYFRILGNLRLWLDYVSEALVLNTVRVSIGIVLGSQAILALVYGLFFPFVTLVDSTYRSGIAAPIVLGVDPNLDLEPYARTLALLDSILYVLVGLLLVTLLPLTLHCAARIENALVREILEGDSFATISFKGWATAAIAVIIPIRVTISGEGYLWDEIPPRYIPVGLFTIPVSEALLGLLALAWALAFIFLVRRPKLGAIVVWVPFLASYLTTLVITLWKSYTQVFVPGTDVPIFLAALALFTLSLHRNIRRSVATFATFSAILVVGTIVRLVWSYPDVDDPVTFVQWSLFFLGLTLVMWIVAAALGYGLRWLAETARAASRDRVARREAEERQERAKAESAELAERARIAREMHDVVAHSMSVISVQAQTAPYRLAASDLDYATRAEFASIASTSRNALREMRALLTMLRGTDTEEAPQTAPQPDLGDLASLVEQSRDAGAHVTLTMPEEGIPDVPATVGLALYRAAQEGLANALRHAPGSDIHITLMTSEHVTGIDVVNTAPPEDFEPAPGSGMGLRGVRERANALGGTVNAGAHADGSYSLIVRIPHAGTWAAVGQPTPQ
ncbi:histidine kinase [Dermabacter hominis 1368]|uniref:histidine kinase n=1 Tax=Dermabacter hominis 1368 TaxID=1450519 RepID=A0ABR4SKY5_9MICO|nr:histidine kinase [Dermabacter hominis 1368]